LPAGFAADASLAFISVARMAASEASDPPMLARAALS
jgi:hypothetical protein